MKTKAIKELLAQNNIEFLRWNGNFSIAIVRAPNGEAVEIKTGCGRQKLMARLQEFKEQHPAAQPPVA